ncbi:YihY/virulence factor BrkB family protein [Bradyrhizobium septentrionale]|uniref:YihY/virulence factor BrkB family protein n=1 Tax=Bradyrhizobium septentrionale TaxID=1404411 RepID=A0A973W1C7_9BRAD|nr:YihY/virulence factor BrkB family protein [Bradyrhizobium septentrionale]UGY14418.1 YihY/virulence factor BrkB family protein [Bradyrhizobium septentrionale]UGY22866.1 YihY/virulence factor BrkB family protein [Bradyrhizobium septentrionale]
MAPRSNWPNDLMLAGATALATLAIYRHLFRSQTPPVQERGAEPVLIETQERGRLAHTPLQIPAAGWKDILLRTYQQIDEDRLLATAAGVVFYGLLAIFPAITALVSSYGLFADPSTISANLQSLALMLPEGSFAIVQDQIARVLAKGTSTLGLTFAVGLLIAIWSANAGMKAVFDALNVVYEEKEKRGFIKLNLMTLTFTIAALLSIMLMVGAVVVVPLLLQQVGLGTRAELIIRFGRWPILVVLLLVALAVLYRYGPSRTKPRWQWLSVGAVVAAVLWLMGSTLLSWYLANFGDYSATYGSLGAAIGLMTWMWMSAIIVLCGAELNSEIEHQTVIDSTEGRRKPLGARGATMADTVGRPS